MERANEHHKRWYAPTHRRPLPLLWLFSARALALKCHSRLKEIPMEWNHVTCGLKHPKPLGYFKAAQAHTRQYFWRNWRTQQGRKGARSQPPKLYKTMQTSTADCSTRLAANRLGTQSYMVPCNHTSRICGCCLGAWRFVALCGTLSG